MNTNDKTNEHKSLISAFNNYELLFTNKCLEANNKLEEIYKECKKKGTNIDEFYKQITNVIDAKNVDLSNNLSTFYILYIKNHIYDGHYQPIFSTQTTIVNQPELPEPSAPSFDMISGDNSQPQYTTWTQIEEPSKSQLMHKNNTLLNNAYDYYNTSTGKIDKEKCTIS